jgi:toxin ParE1/3/4
LNAFIITAEAEQDLDAATEYYAAVENIDLAIRFREMAWRTFERVAASPGVGRERPARSPLTAGLRVWRVDGFPSVLVFYRPESDVVRIVRVLHGARDLDPLL